jgi:hypothetical protein
MSIDWANVNWGYVGILAVLVFLSSLIGSLLTFRHSLWGSLLSALLFAAAFVFWTYYPHQPLLPSWLTEKAAPTPVPPAPVPAQPAAPQKPANPIQDITPPKPNQ